MPLISEPPLTLKDKHIRIRQLPEEILEKLYFLDIIGLKGKMQYNSFLADKYKKYRDLNPDEDWLRFKIGLWAIAMECEEDL